MDAGVYLARIGFEGTLAPTAATLAALQKAHLLAVPFESLDQHFGVPTSLEPEDLFDKIVTRRRGGFCYELNGLFAALLAELGFTVSLLEARPFRRDGTLAPRFAHLAIGVALERQWLVDVGFGYWSPSPLQMGAAGPQRRGRRRFQVRLPRLAPHPARIAGGDRRLTELTEGPIWKIMSRQNRPLESGLPDAPQIEEPWPCRIPR